MKELKKEDLQITELIHHFVREHVEALFLLINFSFLFVFMFRQIL